MSFPDLVIVSLPCMLLGIVIILIQGYRNAKKQKPPVTVILITEEWEDDKLLDNDIIEMKRIDTKA